MLGLGDEGRTTAVVVVGTGVEHDRGGEEVCVGDIVSRLMTRFSSSTHFVDEVRFRRSSSSSSSSSSTSL